MKISQMWLLVGLVMGLIVVWGAAVPSDVSASTLVGASWYPITGCPACTDDTEEACPSGTSGPPYYTDLGCEAGANIQACIVDSNGSYHCSAGPRTPCHKDGVSPYHACNATHDGYCL